MRQQEMQLKPLPFALLRGAVLVRARYDIAKAEKGLSALRASVARALYLFNTKSNSLKNG